MKKFYILLVTTLLLIVCSQQKVYGQAQPSLLSNGWLAGSTVPSTCLTGQSPSFYNWANSQLYHCLNGVYSLVTSVGSGSTYTTFTTIVPPSAITANATTEAVNTTYVSQLYIPAYVTLTGACVLNGGTVGSDKHIFVLYSATGAVLANSTTAGGGTTTATASKYQCVAFTATVSVNQGLYWIGIMSNGSTDNFQAYAANSVPTGYLTGTVSQTYASGPASITASLPVAFNANQGPMMMTY